MEVSSNGIAIWSCGTAVLTASMMGALGHIAVTTPSREAEIAAMGVRELDFPDDWLDMVIRLSVIRLSVGRLRLAGDSGVAFNCNC